MSDDVRIADDFKSGISQVVVEIYGSDTVKNRRRVYRQLELPSEKRIKGIFKTGEREVSCIPSIVRADLHRRAIPPSHE
jgi:hypothetical protein